MISYPNTFESITYKFITILEKSVDNFKRRKYLKKLIKNLNNYLITFVSLEFYINGYPLFLFFSFFYYQLMYYYLFLILYVYLLFCVLTFMF